MSALPEPLAPSYAEDLRPASTPLETQRARLDVVRAQPAFTQESQPGDRVARSPQQLIEALRRVIYRGCPAWLASEREDLVQSALLRLLEIRHRHGEDRTSNAGYVYRVAYSVLIDEIRRRKRRNEVPIEDSTLADRDHRPSPEHEAAGSELDRTVRSCLEDVSEHRRTAIALHLQEYTVPECARALGWSHKRTENLVYRGRADLRRHLAARGVQR